MVRSLPTYPPADNTLRIRESMRERKVYRVLIFHLVDGVPRVKQRMRFATREEADEAFEKLELEDGEFAQVVLPLFEADAA